MKEVDIISKVVGRDTSGKAAMYIPGAGAPSVNLDDYLLKKIWDSVFEIRTDSEGNPYLFEKMPLVTQYGITMYADGGELNLPSIYAGLPIDGETLYWDGGVLKAKGGTEGAITDITSSMVVSALGYTPAKASDLTTLQSTVNDFLSGSDTDSIINKWKELEAFLSGLSESDNLATILGNKADKATTLAGYGITDAYTKTKVDELLGLYVTLKTAQTITGEKDFTGGLKVNGSPIVYDATNKYWKLEGDLLVTGGVTMYASDSAFTPSTIMNGVVVDGVTIGKRASDGALYFMGETGGGLTEVYWNDIKLKPTFATVATSGKYTDLSGTPTLLSSFTNDIGFITSYVDTKNTAGSTNTSSKIFLIGATSQAANPQTYSHDTAYVGTDGYLYSGGAKVLTSHQTIYNLTMQAGAFSAVTFDPNGANKTVNIPTTTSHITEGDNLYYTNARAQAAITGGASTIVTSNLTANRALISNASGKVAVSAVTSTELGYLDGVTSAIQTQLNSKLAATSYTAADVLAKLLTVDGASSGLDADLLDGTHKSGLLTAASSSSATNLSITVGGTTKKITDLYAYKTTQLETARTIWGQSFDGTGNVSGALSGATTGAFSSNVTIGGTLSVASDTTLATKLTLNGIPIYKSQDDVLYIDGNLAVRGGITMYATDAIDVDDVIKNLPIAGSSAKGIAAFNPNDFSVVDGYVSFIGSTGVDESVLVNYAKKTDLSAYLPLSGGNINGDLNIYGTPQAVNNNGKMIFHNLSLNQGGIFKYQGGNTWTVSNSGGTTDYTILHSSNWSQYVTAGDGGNYLPLSGGTMTSGVKLDASANIYLQSTSGNNWNILDVNGKRAFCVEAGGYVGVGRVYDSGKTYRLAVEGNSYIGGYEVIQVAASGAGSYNRICLSTYYTPTDENWQSEIISDYYGNNVCTRGGFTHGVYFKGGRSGFDNFIFLDSSGTPVARISASNTGMNHHFFGDMLVTGGITMYSDIRKKTKLQDVELSLKQIADAPLIEHYYNSDAMRTTHVGSIAQYWAGINDWFCKLDGEGFYTMEIQNAALASAISIARELVKYESKTDKEIRLLKDEVKRLKKEIKILKSA